MPSCSDPVVQGYAGPLQKCTAAAHSLPFTGATLWIGVAVGLGLVLLGIFLTRAAWPEEN